MKYALGLLKSKLTYEYFPGRLRCMTSIYRNVVRPGDPFFDVGAHLGTRAGVPAKLGCDVVAVEPHPHLASYLRNKFGKSSNVLVEEVALAENAGEAIPYCSPNRLTVSSLRPDWTASLSGLRPHGNYFSGTAHGERDDHGLANREAWFAELLPD